ncbi:hypothetical protein B0H19DRAFT_862471, partial [Mycena capillaripes]
RIAVLGMGGIGKTTVAKAMLHRQETTAKYKEHRFFVCCDSASTKLELANLIGAHVGMTPGMDLTQSLIRHFSHGPPSLLVLDNLETLWEPRQLRKDIENFLRLLADVETLALVVTLRGAERPAGVQWTRPFVKPLKPLAQAAARQTLIDIADDTHDIAEIDKILSVISRWHSETTSLMSEGCDRRSNLDLSIALSLSSPRITCVPHAQEVLSLLSILPDGLSDVELRQSNLPIDNIFSCKAALLATSLAYSDDNRRLKALVPIREYMQRAHP